ncbi:uncharacterized protein LOC133711424 [Rosa rugosa]|uniref:uncharacterized protein LOC133711424 n=1 Tax=Rosa rugosa TaxID=74645 RepID=UPI002B4119BB|nr:uncharacterized protein LOC133711424 [Rosa rugosa]
MDASLAVKCTHSGQSFMFCINQYMSYAHLFEYICERFKFSATDDIELHYSLPGCAIFFLRNDDDFKMLFSGAKIYKLDCVDIMVLKNSVSCSKKTSVSFEDSCSGIVDEDDYLTEAFRTEVQKSYLSNEWASYIQCVGQKFRGGSPEFRDRLRKYAIEVGFSFVFIRNDWDRIHAVCSNWGTEGCEWNVRGYVSPANGCFIIGELDNVHSCKGVLRKQKHELLGSKIVKTCIEEDISYNLSLKPREIISKFKSAYGFDISYKVAWKAKQKAREMIYGSEADSFNKLTWYRDAVFETNPGSSFVLEVDPSSNRFQRLFLAYAGCVKGFEFCLPVLFVDGTFGKSVYKGQILCATGKNGNHGFFPLAMCVCDSETDANWSFFFQHLKNLLEPQGRKITFISDRGVGLLSAFDKIFPGNPHLFCYKHLVHNLMTKYNGKGSSVLKDDVKKKFFELAYSCTEKEYRFHLRELREAGGADIIDPFLADLPVQNWCRAFFPGCRYGIMANSIAESFNAWFAVEREMPMYTMLDQTRIRVMQMMGERRDEAQLWTSQLTPVMEGRLKEGMEKACRFNVHYSHTNVYEVRSKYSYVVDLGTPSCSCKKWEINCFPCCHGLTAIQAASLDVYAFIDKHFHVDYCQKCYDFPIYPISNVDMASSESSSSGFILPPNAKRPPGRPRLKRFKSRGECEKKLIRCSRCGKMGQHNKKTCTEPI